MEAQSESPHHHFSGITYTSRHRSRPLLGTQRTACLRPGREVCDHRHSKTRLNHKHKTRFEKGRLWYAGVELPISVLRRTHGLGRCLAHASPSFIVGLVGM
jgi:hypothetical protein